MNKTFNIAFIGVGLMGHGIVKNILKKGFTVTALNHPGNQPTGDLEALGLQCSDDRGTMVRSAEVIFLCVTGTPEVEAIMLSPGGVLDELQSGTIIVDCSTARPESTIGIAAKVAAKGGHYVDAPMTRTPKEAEEGRLNIMVGGDADVVDKVMPILQAYGENIYRAGGVGSGHTLKLIHNFMSLGNAVLASEAIVCAEKSGVDMDTFCDVIMTGGGDSVVFRRLLPFIQNGDESSFRFSISNSEKDMGYYADMAKILSAPAGVADAVRRVFADALAGGMGGEAVPRLIERMKKI